MFVKINRNSQELNGNSGSSANVFQYLDKENREAGNIKDSDFFNNEKQDIDYKEAIKSIDKNVQGLGKKDSKFFMLNVSPSDYEIKHIIYKEYKIKIDSVKDLNESQKTFLENQLKNYTNKLMDIYAMNFEKGLKKEDLNYFANIEHQRKFNHADRKIIENNTIKTTIKELEKDKSIIVNFSKYEEIQKERIKELEKQYYKGQDGKIIILTPEELKQQEQLMIDKQQASAILDDMGMGIDNNTIQDLKDDLFDSNTREIIEAYYAINKEIIWVENKEIINDVVFKRTKILSNYVNNQNIEIQRKIQTEKDLIEIYRNKNNNLEKINNRIDDLKKLYNRTENGTILKKGMNKEGIQTHIHVVVSRKTKKLVDEKGERTLAAKKISPNANSRGHTQTNNDGSKRITGFNHERFKIASNELFKEQFNYKSRVNEKYIAKTKGKVINQVKQFTGKVLGEEAAKAINMTTQAISFAKTAVLAPQTLPFKILTKTVLKPVTSVVSQFKSILLKGEILTR